MRKPKKKPAGKVVDEKKGGKGKAPPFVKKKPK